MDDKKYYDYMISVGFTPEEAERGVEDRKIMNDLYKEPREPREITSSTYISADRRQSKDIQKFLGWGRR
nr:MAG TPA: hypothetical protein [Bacteriophage sp.]